MTLLCDQQLALIVLIVWFVVSHIITALLGMSSYHRSNKLH